jgi:hypothetical protein
MQSQRVVSDMEQSTSIALARGKSSNATAQAVWLMNFIAGFLRVVE